MRVTFFLNVAGTDGDRKPHDFRPTETIDIDDDWQRNERGVTELRGMDGTVIGKHICGTAYTCSMTEYYYNLPTYICLIYLQMLLLIC